MPPTRSVPPPAVRAAVAATAALLALALGAALLAPTLSGAQSEGELRQRAGQARARERSLAADLARLDSLVRRLDTDLAVIERRRAEVQAELDADRVRLATIREDLRAQRRRVVRLRARLRQARGMLSARLVALYQTPRPDVITVVMQSRGFADLLEQATYVRFIGRQDARVIHLVRQARLDAASAVRRLARDERRQQEITVAIAARRDALVAISASLAERRAAAARARALRAAALTATRASRRRIEGRIAALEAARARAASIGGPGGPWVIPGAIVQCESGGQNVPPNSAGASGFYQILPSTWRLFGGSGPAAWRASKGEQDRVAARIWNGGAGASNWVCAALVR